MERTNGFFETSFLPGRSFASPQDFNAQLAGWLPQANAREHRRIGGRPATLWEREAAALAPLPPVAPEVRFHARTRLPRDYYVRVDTNDYSVDPSMIGRLVDVTADLGHVRVHHEGRLVASHERLWARRQTVVDPEHVASAKLLRQAYQQEQRERAAAAGQGPRPVVEARSLGDYDELFGIDFAAAGQVA